MSNSISTLLLRNLSDVFGENDPVRRRAAIDEMWHEDGVFYDPNNGSTVAATRSIASRTRSGLHTLTFNISQLPSLSNWAMAGGSNGYRGALASRQLTPGLISSSRETAGQATLSWTLLPTTPRMTKVFRQPRLCQLAKNLDFTHLSSQKGI